MTVAWVVSFCFLTSSLSQQQFDVLKVSNVPFPHTWAAGASLSAPFHRNIIEFTFCYRVLIDSYNEGGFWFVAAKPNDKDFFVFRESLGLDSGFELDGFQFSALFLMRNIPDGGLGNMSMPYWHHSVLVRNIDPGKWNHFCVAYSSLKHILHKYQDGHKVFSFHYADKVEDPLPPTLFETLEILKNIRGHLTDLHIFSSFFTEEQMKVWTTSCDHGGGNGDIFT